ncbi:MAG: hypothetical protein QOG20_55 [Pseudonocardiales bacterium]|nr:hypothetical protein [Pseudonocardiales bacterium]
MTAERSTRRRNVPEPVLGWIDWAQTARGASTAFSILVVGGLAQPVVGTVAPPVGAVWLIIVAVLAFAVAGCRIGDAGLPIAHGAATAVFGYLFVLPLVVFAAHGIDAGQVVGTAAVAVVVGGAAGWLAGQARSRTPQG